MPYVALAFGAAALGAHIGVGALINMRPLRAVSLAANGALAGVGVGVQMSVSPVVCGAVAEHAAAVPANMSSYTAVIMFLGFRVGFQQFTTPTAAIGMGIFIFPHPIATTIVIKVMEHIAAGIAFHLAFVASGRIGAAGLVLGFLGLGAADLAEIPMVGRVGMDR